MQIDGRRVGELDRSKAACFGTLLEQNGQVGGGDVEGVARIEHFESFWRNALQTTMRENLSLSRFLQLGER